MGSVLARFIAPKSLNRPSVIAVERLLLQFMFTFVQALFVSLSGR